MLQSPPLAVLPPTRTKIDLYHFFPGSHFPVPSPLPYPGRWSSIWGVRGPHKTVWRSCVCSFSGVDSKKPRKPEPWQSVSSSQFLKSLSYATVSPPHRSISNHICDLSAFSLLASNMQILSWDRNAFKSPLDLPIPNPGMHSARFASLCKFSPLCLPSVCHALITLVSCLPCCKCNVRV